jgi:hypothetical protein
MRRVSPVKTSPFEVEDPVDDVAFEVMFECPAACEQRRSTNARATQRPPAETRKL